MEDVSRGRRDAAGAVVRAVFLLRLLLVGSVLFLFLLLLIFIPILTTIGLPAPLSVLIWLVISILPTLMSSAISMRSLRRAQGPLSLYLTRRG